MSVPGSFKPRKKATPLWLGIFGSDSVEVVERSLYIEEGYSKTT